MRRATAAGCAALFLCTAAAASSEEMDLRHAFLLPYTYAVDGENEFVYFGGTYYDIMVRGRKEHWPHLYRQRIGSSEREVFHSVETGASIAEFPPSADGRYLALISRASRRGKTRLVILDSAGNPLTSQEDAWSPAWSPDHAAVVYTRGQYERRHGDPPFLSEGTWVSDTRTKEHRQIFEGGRHVAWASFDGAIYVYEAPTSKTVGKDHVVRIDPVSGEWERTQHQGIRFSPTGRYYYGPPGRSPKDLYLTEKDQEPLPRSRELRIHNPRWVPGAVDLLAFYSESSVVVYDPSRDRLMKLEVDAILGDSQGRLVTLQGGVIRKQLRSELLH